MRNVSSGSLTANWPRGDRIWLATGGLVVPAIFIYLCGGVVSGGVIGTFLVGILLPAVALSSCLPAWQAFAPAFRIAVGGALAIVCLFAVSFLRKAVGFGAVGMDAVLALVLTVIAVRTGAVRGLAADFTAPAVRAAYPYLFGALPLLFALTWSAFAVPVGTELRFYGLSVVDFGTLSGVTALVKNSPGLPLVELAGAGPMHYHWLFFTLPAWAAGFLGQQVPCANALVACNLVVAGLLFLVLAEWARQAPPRPLTPAAACRVAAIVCFAPLTVYYYRTLVHLLHCRWFTVGTRNDLLLSIVNGMHVFGNNTFALVLCVLFLLLLTEWNRQPRWQTGLTAVVLLAAVVPVSITLAFPMALLVALLLLLNQIRRPIAMVGLFAVVGLAALPAYWKLGILCPGDAPIAFGFDQGQYVQNLLFSLLPLTWLASLAPRETWRQPTACLLALACVAVPTFLYIRNNTTGGEDFSMKTATLLLVAFTPLVAVNYNRFGDGLRAFHWRTWIGVVLVAAGLLATLAYSGQFVFYRLSGAVAHDSIPLDYAATLEYIRGHAAPFAVVIDPLPIKNLRRWSWANILAERQQYLPRKEYNEWLLPGYDTAELDRRRTQFQQWQESGYTNNAFSKLFATHANYLVLDCAIPTDTNWRRVFHCGEWFVLQSNRCSTRTPMEQTAP